ncbi:MAG TPA: hypothetical protein VNA17_03970, partial [Pyrinomonadaceae bacterium]|nr:hypothetical protein [Pyrinomonadaceae bacterium]
MRPVGIMILIAVLAALTNAQKTGVRIVHCVAAGVPLGYRIVRRVRSIACPKAYVLEAIDEPESKIVAPPAAASSTSAQSATAKRVITKTSSIPEFAR